MKALEFFALIGVMTVLVGSGLAMAWGWSGHDWHHAAVFFLGAGGTMGWAS